MLEIDIIEREQNVINKPNNFDKWRFTLYTVIIFIIVMNPFTYMFVQKIIGGIFGKIANPINGCPTTTGFIIHTILFALIIRLVMDFDI